VARDGRQLETAAFTCETAGGGWVQPPPRGFANEARNVQLPGVLCGFHPRAVAAAEGRWPRYGRQLKTAAFGGVKPRGRLGAAPQGGLASEARNVEVPGVLCDFHPRALGAAGGSWARHGRQLKTAAFSCETAGGGWGPPPPPLALSPLPTLGEGRGGTRLLSFWRRCRGVRGEG